MFTFNELVTLVEKEMAVEVTEYGLSNGVIDGEYGYGFIRVYGTQKKEEKELKLILLHEVGHYIYREWSKKDRPNIKENKKWAQERKYKEEIIREEGWAQGFAEWALENEEEFYKLVKEKEPKLNKSAFKGIAILLSSLVFLGVCIGYRLISDGNLSSPYDTETIIK